MKPTDPCLLDSSVWIEGEANPVWFAELIEGLPDVSTCATAAAEFAVGMYSPRKKATRDAARAFLEKSVFAVAVFAHLPDDFLEAARLIGEAIYRSAAKPSFADGLIAACALRLDRTVWTTNDKEFKAMDEAD